MATFRTFEDMEAWRKARQLVEVIYEMSKKTSFARDFGLRDQIRRASVSITANITEGFERDGTGEFIQFLGMAKGSAGEVRAHLYIAFDQHYIDEQTFDHALVMVTDVSRLIRGLMQYLRTTRIRGSKYKYS